MFATVKNVRGRRPATIPHCANGGGRFQLLAHSGQILLKPGQVVAGNLNAGGLIFIGHGLSALKLLDQKALDE